MFQNLRVDIKTAEQGWLKNAIISSVNDVANLFIIAPLGIPVKGWSEKIKLYLSNSYLYYKRIPLVTM